VPLRNIPDYVQKAFIAAEDRRFYQHHGVDERGIIRAFIGNLAEPGRPQGGSTITQQVVKNLLVGEDVTYERKIREMIVASRVEATLSKNEILELYLNSAYLGRGSWGVEMAARSYFGKSAKDLALGEGAMLAGLLKGPNYFNPDRHPDRAKERLTYVVGRMQEDGFIDADQKNQALSAAPVLVANERLRRDSGFDFTDYLGREAKTEGVKNLTASSYTVHSTINAPLQRATETALQEGLAEYEIANGRMQFQGAEANVAEAVQKIQAQKAGDTSPAWQQALETAHLPLYDVHWTPAIVVSKGGGKGGGDGIKVGLLDGRVLPLTAWTGEIRRQLSLYDVVYVRVAERKAKVVATKPNAKPNPKANTKPDVTASSGAIAQLRVRPTVQGAALVLENKTGRILAMAGSFSYPLSQLNRTSQTQRQPGSAIKPVTYLAALQKGMQPNTLVLDDPITLPPIGGNVSRSEIIAREYNSNARDEDYWTPKNADGGMGSLYTLRRGLENSRNIITARLLDGGIEADPEASLDKVCSLAVEARIYNECVRYYPFILGAQPVRMIDLAAFYAAIANEGARPAPYAIDSIEQDGQAVYQHPSAPLPMIGSADPTSFYQLKTMLQGVVARGTAHSIASLSPYVAGKTGTTDNAVDAWFVGFTNDVTVAVWVGYDNADGKRRSLGSSATGARVALPLFHSIIDAVWTLQVAPKVALSGPSAEAKKHMIDLPIDYSSGDRVTSGGRAFVEHFRLGADGRFNETQYQLVSREEAYASREQYPSSGQWTVGDQGSYWGRATSSPERGWNRSFFPFAPWQAPQYQQQQRPQQQQRGLFGQQRYEDQDDVRQRARRRDPDYFWGGRFN
jgi:membrane carboxypeptidase/penicillin-binding protein